MVILNPWVSTLKVWIVSRKGNNLLIKSILTGCDARSFTGLREIQALSLLQDYATIFHK